MWFFVFQSISVNNLLNYLNRYCSVEIRRYKICDFCEYLMSEIVFEIIQWK